MKKIIAMLFVFSIMLVSGIFAEPRNARMDALGVNNWQIEDEYNIWLVPAGINVYKNLAQVELGDRAVDANAAKAGGYNDMVTDNTKWGGVSLETSYGVWGIYLGRPYEGALGGVGAVTGDVAALGATPTPATNTIDLFYGLKSAPVGVLFTYAARSAVVKTETVATTGITTTTSKASDMGITVGSSLLNGSLDVALQYNLPSMEVSSINSLPANADSKLKSNASGNIALLARLNSPALQGKLLTSIMYVKADASSKATNDNNGDGVTTDAGDPDLSVDLKNTTNTIGVNATLNNKPNPETLVLAGIGFVNTATTLKAKSSASAQLDDDSDKTSTTTIPVNIGVEHQTTKSVKTRAGLFKNIYSSTVEKMQDIDVATTITNVTTTTKANDPATVSIGLGVDLSEKLTLDAVVNQDVLFTGTYIVSGVAESLSSKLSVCYKF